jgi:hypothetical protein
LTEDNRYSISQIILKWHASCSIKHRGDGGKEYLRIPNSTITESLEILAQTLKDHGYSFEEINDSSVSIQLVNTCWKPNKIRKMSKSAVKEAMLGLADDWNAVLGSLSDIVISRPEEKPKKIEKPLELNPSDRVKMDTSDMSNAPIDEEIFAELAALGTFPGMKDE